jgi:Zn-dependent protease/predicted transcriptional regulator
MVHGLWFSAYVFALFLCVVLHEYGHAFAAKKYGVRTRDIILSPIGGVARLEQLPEKPKHEMIIAFAGPAVNVIIAVIVGLISLFVLDGSILESDFDILRIKGLNEFLVFLLALNVMLFVFNLVPAFPMDGGRVLRSGLAMKMGRVKATRIASMVGRVLAIGFVIFGLYNNMFVLAFIGIFIFTSATAEYQYTKINSKLEEFNVADIMRTEFTRLHIGDLFEKPIELYKRNMESNFLVFDSLGYIAGSLPEAFIRDKMKTEDGARDQVSSLMSPKTDSVKPQASLKEVYELMNKKGLAIVAVFEEDELVGVVDRAGLKRALQG